jgi:release factor glutamine methyltransferase
MPAAAEIAGGARRGACTVGAARREWAKRFRARDIDSAELDARILIGCALGLDRDALARADSRQLGSGEEAAIAVLAERRLAHEPVARIVGRKEFWSLPLFVDASTLIPRPETETVVEAALAEIDASDSRMRPLRIADLGTGSGAILLALLSELPEAWGVGTDASVAALFAARENARHLRLDRARFLACDMAAALGGPFDVVVSNPP